MNIIDTFYLPSLTQYTTYFIHVGYVVYVYLK